MQRIREAKLSEAGIDYKVYKNTFMRFAAKECGYDELSDVFEGITAVAFCNEDAVAPAKLIYDYVTDNKLNTLSFKGGVINKKVTAKEEMVESLSCPTKDVCFARLPFGSINAPISNLVYALDAIQKAEKKSRPLSY